MINQQRSYLNDQCSLPLIPRAYIGSLRTRHQLEQMPCWRKKHNQKARRDSSSAILSSVIGSSMGCWWLSQIRRSRIF